jgi:hypothetical protein
MALTFPFELDTFQKEVGLLFQKWLAKPFFEREFCYDQVVFHNNLCGFHEQLISHCSLSVHLLVVQYSECRQYITWKGMNRCLWQLIPQQGRQWLRSMPLHWQPKWAFFHNFNDLLSLWEYIGMPWLFEICLLLAVCCSDPFLILWFSETCDLMSFDDGSSAWFQGFSISSLSW